MPALFVQGLRENRHNIRISQKSQGMKEKRIMYAKFRCTNIRYASTKFRRKSADSISFK